MIAAMAACPAVVGVPAAVLVALGRDRNPHGVDPLSRAPTAVGGELWQTPCPWKACWTPPMNCQSLMLLWLCMICSRLLSTVAAVGSSKYSPAMGSPAHRRGSADRESIGSQYWVRYTWPDQCSRRGFVECALKLLIVRRQPLSASPITSREVSDACVLASRVGVEGNFRASSPSRRRCPRWTRSAGRRTGWSRRSALQPVELRRKVLLRVPVDEPVRDACSRAAKEPEMDADVAAKGLLGVDRGLGGRSQGRAVARPADQ